MKSKEEIEKKLKQAEKLRIKYKDYVEDESYYLGIVDALKFVLSVQPLELEEENEKE